MIYAAITVQLNLNILKCVYLGAYQRSKSNQTILEKLLAESGEIFDDDDWQGEVKISKTDKSEYYRFFRIFEASLREPPRWIFWRQ